MTPSHRFSPFFFNSRFFSSGFFGKALFGLVLLMLVDVSSVLAATPAGRLMFVHGDATIKRGGEIMPASRGDDIYPGDTIETAGASSVQIRYSDGGTMAVSPQSRFTLEGYRHDTEAPDNSSQSTQLLRGGLRVISGAIGRNAPENVSHATPVATMGIRGTSFQLLHLPSAAETALENADPGSYLRVEDGQVAFITEAGTRLANPGDIFFAARIDQTPALRPDALGLFEQAENLSMGGTSGSSGNDEDDASGEGNQTNFMRQAGLLDDATSDQLTDEIFARLRLRDLENDVPGKPPVIDPDTGVEVGNQWLSQAPRKSNTLLAPRVGLSSLMPLFRQKIDPRDYGGDYGNVELFDQPDDVTWGYWEAGTSFPTYRGARLNQPLFFVTASPDIQVSEAFPETVDIPGEGFTFNLAANTSLMDLAGGESPIDITGGGITLSSAGIVDVSFDIDGHGSLEGSGSEFSLSDISLENIGDDFFDGGLFNGRYVGEDAEAIMGLIEAWNADAEYYGAGVFER